MSLHGVVSNGMNRRTFLRGAGVTGALSLAGCVGGIGGGDDSTITYGVISPMTGAYSSLGPAQRKGAKLGAETVSQSDAFDFEIDVVTADSGTDPTQGVQAAQQLISREGATYLMGAISSAVAIAINGVALDEEVIYNPGAAAVPITGSECNEYVFRAETNTAQVAAAVSEYTVKNLGTKVWFHIADYAYGTSVLEWTRKRMKQADKNVEVVGISRSKLGASNYDPFISQIGNSNAEVAVLGMTGGDLITFVKQAASQGLKESVNLMSPTMTFQVVRKALGSTAVGTFGGVRYLPTMKRGNNQQFVNAYKDAYGEVPDNFARVGYQSILMTARGIQQADSMEPTAVKDVLPGLEMTTILGQNQFRTCNHQALNPTWGGEIVKGEGIPDVELVREVPGPKAVPPCTDVGCTLG